MSQLNPSTVKLYETILRHVKGIISACEVWLREKKEIN
jgi:hypothetical protein